MNDTIIWLGPLLGGAIGGGLGSFLTSVGAETVNSRVRKSQRIELVRDEDLALLVQWADEMQSLATTYWTKSGVQLGADEPILRAKIIATQQMALDLIAFLFSGQMKQDCDVKFVSFMDAVGGGAFGNPKRAAEPERLVGVYLHGMAFTQLAKTCRRKLKRGWLA